jgi:hypothetical protein
MVIDESSSQRIETLLGIISKLDEMIVLLDEYELTFAALRANEARELVQAEIDGRRHG